MATTEGIGGCLSVNAALPATFDEPGYAALTWIDVEQGGDVPEFGAEHSVVTFTPLKTGIVNKFHGEINYGSLSYTGALDPEDPGQPILEQARRDKSEIAFRATSSDGTIRYFAGKVMSWMTGSAVGSVVAFTAQIEITRETIAGV